MLDSRDLSFVSLQFSWLKLNQYVQPTTPRNQELWRVEIKIYIYIGFKFSSLGNIEFKWLLKRIPKVDKQLRIGSDAHAQLLITPP